MVIPAVATAATAAAAGLAVTKGPDVLKKLNLQRPEVSCREEEMLLNGAYLVSDRPWFEAELRELAGEYFDSGVELELMGPWPPYNFVSAELGAA